MIIDSQLSRVLQQFNLQGQPILLSGGTQPVYRLGDVVLKRVETESLENNHSQELVAWMAGFSPEILEEGFRMPKVFPTVDGNWLASGGWTAWTYLEGRHAGPEDIPACIQAINAYHKALRHLPPHPRMKENKTPWGLAHRWCWGEKPDFVQPVLRDLVGQLYQLREPISGFENQVIHGDLSPENILITPGLSPGIIDLSPFWGPAAFALAIYANFVGPRRGDVSILTHFEDIPQFDQLLVRAGIRMLLVMSVINYLDEWDTCSEKTAAEMIIEYVLANRKQKRTGN